MLLVRSEADELEPDDAVLELDDVLLELDESDDDDDAPVLVAPVTDDTVELATELDVDEVVTPSDPVV